MISIKTRLECEHSFVSADSPEIYCDFDGECDGKLYECCLFGKSFTEEMELIAENENNSKR